MNDHLLNSSFLLNTLMGNITDNIYFKDAESRFVMINETFCRWTDWPEKEVIGKTDFDLFSEEHAREAFADELRILETGEPLINKEEKETWRDGRVTWVSTTKMPIRDPEGKIIGTFGISRDITEQKELEQSLRVARKKAEDAAQTKSIFLANMSHEIRTPLNAVVGMSDLLIDSEMAPEQHEYVETINTSSEALLEIVNDILDLSKIESSKFELEVTPFNLVQTVEKSVDVVAPRAAQKGLELMQYFSGTVPDTLVGDAARLRQVLLNLLSNAVKFTPRGEILVEVGGIPTGGGKYKINFLISDTGIGMTPEETARIFQPFEQADPSITRKYGGTGLGLTICSKLVEMMGGEMTVQSKKDIGSTFRFFIVAQRASSSMVPEVPFDPEVLNNRHILLVDDNETNLRIVQSEVEQAGMIPHAFRSGAEALTALPQLDHLDIAVLDYTMPDMDGCTLAQKLRSHDAFGSKPILIASSSGRPHSESAHVVNRWMSKPIKKRLLHEALADLLGGMIPLQKAPLEKTLDPECMAEVYPHRILLVEDNKVNQVVTLKMLEKMGYKADLAEDGQQAVDLVLSKPYDIILMDIQMPVMGGLEATRIIRNRLPENEQPQIIGVSAHALPEHRDEAVAAGMNNYLSKPLKMDEFAKALTLSAQQPPPPQ